MMILSLAQLLAKLGPLPPSVALDVAETLAARLADEHPSVADLLALRPEAIEVELLDDLPPAVSSVRMRKLGSSLDLQPYMAWPEYGAWLCQAGGWTEESVGGEPAVVYCLGVLLQHMLTDRPPVTAGDLMHLAMRHLRDGPPPLTDEELPHTLRALVYRATAAQRDGRFPSVETMLRSIRAVQPSRPPPLRAAALRSESTGRCIALGAVGAVGPDGFHQILVGRSDVHTRHAPDLDLADEPAGPGVHRRQAVLRCGLGGWAVQEWLDPARARGPDGRPTAVNGRSLTPGERRPIGRDDVIAFGPVRMRFGVIES